MATASITRPADAPRAAMRIAAWSLWLGMAAILLPTLYRLATLQWVGSLGTFHWIVFLLGGWLIARELPAMRQTGVRPAPWRVAVLLVPLLLIYAVARLGTLVVPEAFAAYALLLTVLYAFVGLKAMQGAWFALAYPLLAMPFEPVLNPASMGMRLWICDASVALLHALGLPIVAIGQTIFVDSYVIVLQDACSGLAAILSLGAVGLFYVYVNRGPRPLYLALCAIAMVAMAIAANFVRVLGLVAATHWLGDATAQGVMHESSGLLTFAVAVGGVILFDTLAWPLLRGTRAAQ